MCTAKFTRVCMYVYMSMKRTYDMKTRTKPCLKFPWECKIHACIMQVIASCMQNEDKLILSRSIK